MRKRIIPSIISENKEDLIKKINRIKNYSSLLQLDIMDGKFVKNESLNFNFKLPKSKVKYEIHLMTNNTEFWIKKNYKKANLIIFHIESTKNPEKIINLIKRKKKKVGIAINPNTKVKKIIKYLGIINQVTVMTVNPGKYGAKFLPETLKKIKEIRKLNKKIEIEVDGGINNKTIKLAYKAGANKFISGSYLQNGENIKENLKTLNGLIK